MTALVRQLVPHVDKSYRPIVMRVLVHILKEFEMLL